MKGLMLNRFYSSAGNLRLLTAFLLAFSVFSLFTGNPTALELLVYISIAALPVCSVAGAREDHSSKWSKFELTMPVRRRDIVRCNYLSYLFWVLSSLVFAVAVTGLATLLHRSNMIVSAPALGAGISLFAGGLFYPVYYVTGMEKLETVLIISVLSGIGITVALLNILRLMAAETFVRTLLFIVLYLSFFAVSYLVSLFLYSKKEF